MKLFISKSSILFMTLITGGLITSNVGLTHNNPNFRHTIITHESMQYSSIYAQFPGRLKPRSPRRGVIHDDDRREQMEEICERRWDEDDLDDCREEAREDRRDNWDDRRERMEDRWD